MANEWESKALVQENSTLKQDTSKLMEENKLLLVEANSCRQLQLEQNQRKEARTIEQPVIRSRDVELLSTTNLLAQAYEEQPGPKPGEDAEKKRLLEDNQKMFADNQKVRKKVE